MGEDNDNRGSNVMLRRDLDKRTAYNFDLEVRQLYRIGGMSALVFGIGYIFIIAFYSLAGAPPTSGEAMLNYLTGRTTLWWGIIGLSVLTDLLLVPVTLSLYHSLKGVSKYVMQFAAGFVSLFVVLDLAVTWPNYTSLISLSGNYAAATTDAQRSLYIGAANYAVAVLNSSTEAVYSIVVLGFGIFLIGLVMLKGGVFGKGIAYLSLLTGGLGVVGELGSFIVKPLGEAVIITSLLTMVWAFLIGYRLFKLGHST